MTKNRKTKVPTHDATFEGRGGRFWTQWIKPKGAALLAQNLTRSHFICKNHGPDTIRLVAEHGEVFDLSPDAVRATYVCGAIRVENNGEKSVLIEFEFLPIYLKY